MSNVLNRQTIESLVSKVRRSGGKQVELVDDREAGLRVRAGQRSATWQVSVRLHNGKRSRIKLGSWPAMGIADARRAAQLKKAEVLEGVDPNEEKREVAREALRKAQQRRIVRDVLDQYDHERLSGLRTGAATRRALDGQRGLLKPFALRDITSITAGDILEEVRNHRHRAPIAANRNLAYAKAFFNWCMGEQILDTNPAATIKKPAKERVRDRFHTIEELEEIWVAAGRLGYPFGPLVQLLIALPMRRTEVTSIKLAELDLAADAKSDEAVWTLPAERTKVQNALRVPLSALARSLILEALHDPARYPDSPFLFSTTGDTPVSGFSKAKSKIDAAIHAKRLERAGDNPDSMEPMPHWTFHDLRTSFSTQASTILKADMNVVDRMLNHVASSTTSKIKRVYNKSEMFDERKQVLADWGELLEREFEIGR